MKRLFKLELLLALCAVAFLDRVTKWWALAYLRPDGTIRIIPEVFHLTFTKNSGAAFSILSGKNTFLIIISMLLIIFFFFNYFKLKTKNHKKQIFRAFF